jgi:hypothetical protein
MLKREKPNMTGNFITSDAAGKAGRNAIFEAAEKKSPPH